MCRRILVAVDGSESSVFALRQAFPLARAERCPVRVISVVPPYRGELRVVGVKEQLSDLLTDPHRRALALAKEAAQEAHTSIETMLEEGEPHEKIVEEAEDFDCDLIVMGVRGHNPAEDILMGSMTERVIGYSRTDVLVIPLGKRLGLESILVAVDGSENSYQAAQRAFRFNRSYGSRLDVLTVADVPPHLYGISPETAANMIAKARKDLHDIKERCRAEGIEAEFLVHEGSAAEKITEVALARHAGLIVMGSHGRTGLTRLLMGSVTERVIGSACCPVLVART
ncbi:MAG: universal stress protein [Thermodesulfobacteriota bacterium]